MEVKLSVVSGPTDKKEFGFQEPGGFTFGRADDCTCVVRGDRTFSRHHFYLEINPPNVALKDLGSLNGTYVNGSKYGGRPSDVTPENAAASQPTLLRDGDRLKAGVYELLLSIDALALCVNCGTEIPEEKRKAAEFVGGTYLCSTCREKDQPKAGAQEGNAQAAPPLSVEQRKKAEDDPAGVVHELLKHMLRGQKSDAPPEVLGYEIHEVLGTGGFGVVYSAIRKSDGRKVAIKTMLQTRKPAKRQLLQFEREKAISIQLRHPHIVHCEAAAMWGDVHFFEMEHMDGGSVWDLLKVKGKLSVEEATPIMLQTLEGLAYAHRAELDLDFGEGRKKVTGVIHRDLKPPNILLSGQPGKWTAKVSDFGLSKAFAEAGMTKGSVTLGAGDYCGTPPYVAPEHIINYRYLKPSSDVFEMAATFYHMLTGAFVWPLRPEVEPIKIILESKVRPIRDHDRGIPKKLAAVIDRALALKPEDRYEDGTAMLNAMKKAAS